MIQVSILSPSWSRSFEADAVWLPATLGEFEVLKGHAPIISTLEKGQVRWRAAEKVEALDIEGGIVKLENDNMQICVE